MCVRLMLMLACVWTVQAGEPLELSHIFSSKMFQGKTVANIQWLPNAFTFTKTNNKTGALDIYRHDLATGKEELLLHGAQLRIGNQPVTMTAYKTTANPDILLITGRQKQIWRHSYAAPYYLYNLKDKTLTALAGGDDALQNLDLSPDGKQVAFVKANDLYIADVNGSAPVRLTHDGSFNLLNGVFDWVYEEEFGRADAFRWSPDSKRIAFWRTDQSRVKTFNLVDEVPRYTTITPLKYPKAGEQNAVVSIGVIELQSKKVSWMDIGDNDDIYIPRIHWTNKDNSLAIQKLNRKQNHLQLLLADVTTGQTKVVLEDKNEAWIDITDDFHFLKNKDCFLWTSEKDGWRHIYLSDYEGKEVAQLTKGEWEVSSILHFDEAEGMIYFDAHYHSAIGMDIAKVNLKGKKFSLLSPEGGWHQARFSPDGSHYVGYASSVSQPTQVKLHKNDGSQVRILEENEISALKKYNLPYPEFFSFETTDGISLNAYMIKPVDFDPSKKYPVLVFGYGGPGSQMVINRWGLGSRSHHVQRVLWHQYLTQQGYLIFCVDNRGTGGRGKAFRNLAYGDLSKWAVHDQIEGAKYLKKQAYVDPDRLGFWGWSGGGYLTCMILTRAADHFSTGIAVASVSDFRNYDTIWTERYMGLPQENERGYDAANVLTYAKYLKGNLLIIHGSGDDNVHPGNSLQFVNKLIALDRQFDLMIYPNRNHRIDGGNTSKHLHTLMSNYVLENL